MNPRLHSFEDLQYRLLKLEKQNRRFKQLGLIVMILPALLLVMGQAASKKTVEANEFILRDKSGNVRARLSMHESLDFPQMDLFDDKGRPSVELSGGTVLGPVGVQGGGVILYDSQGHERGNFLVSDTTAYLRLSDVNGTLRSAVAERAVVLEDGAFIASHGQGNHTSRIDSEGQSCPN